MAALAWPPWPRELPGTRCRFDLAPPRNFLYPAVLLVLAERPTHGYRVWEVLGELGFGTLDRPAVYRVLADLERDGLVQRVPGPRDGASPEERRGLSRQVYEATADGRACLQAWMAVVAAEREALDVVLRRYWQASALPAALPRARSEDAEHPGAPASQPTVAADVLPEEADGGPRGTRPPSGALSPVRYRVAPDRSSLVVAARSNVGPIAFTSTGLSGWVEAVVADGTLVAEPSPRAELRLPVASLLSGNRLYDRELHRRVDARRYPDVEVRLAGAVRLGAGNCFLVTGEVTMHGQTVRLEGVVRTTVVGPTTRRARSAGRADERVVVSGEHVVDVRSFGMATPSMGPLRLDPDVQLSLHLEADTLG
ncbi:helix-turn-helix transcriptional regulator [Aciditerrimonas ferrireducens]|uniref:helix-turn-helix transcriptional regulator n=1 Tax=Aciditerrimonas ferrireducens TaxID=667306 RepID=UPI002003BBE8|nr:helix-turn-helix transcriptional regulator [Aciditerrimonas ferrireducens]MCK4177970.1 helix-turn-helix transcriptional regulator [Aciditerrimonas ferrireducens]